MTPRPTVVSVPYERQLGPVTALRPGEWTRATASGRVAISCCHCGGIFDLSDEHRVQDGGLVVPAVSCEYVPCGEFSYIRLKNYADEVLT